MPSWSQSSNHPPQHPHLLFTSLTLLITPQPTHHITNHIPYPPHQQPHLLPPSPLPSHQQHPLLTLPPTSPATSPTHPLANHITYPPPRQPHPINHIPCPSHQQPHTLPTLLPTTSPIQPTTRLTNPSTYPPHQHMQALSWALGQRLTFKPGPRQTGQGVRAGTAAQVRPNQGRGAATQVSCNLAHAACRHQCPLCTEKLNIALNTIVLASGLGLLHCVSMHTGTLNAALHIFNTPSWALLWISPWTLQMWHCTLLSW